MNGGGCENIGRDLVGGGSIEKMGYVFIIPPSLRNDTKEIDDVVDKVETRAKSIMSEFIFLDKRLGVRCTTQTLGSIDEARGVCLEGFFGAKRD